ncbi:hypothetical protein RYX36_032458 [Vicia faba]
MLRYVTLAGGKVIDVLFLFRLGLCVVILVKELTQICREEGVEQKNPNTSGGGGDLHHSVVSHEDRNGLAVESSWIGTKEYSSQLVVPDALEFVNRFEVEVPIYYRPPRDGEVELVTGYAPISHQVYNKVEDYYKFTDAVNQLVDNGFACALLSH